DGALHVPGAGDPVLLGRRRPQGAREPGAHRSRDALRRVDRRTAKGLALMSGQLVTLDHFATHKRVWRRMVQTARLCCGIPDYDNYVRHVLEKHPDREPMDYPTFF